MSIDPDLRNQIRRLFYVKHFKIHAICQSLNVHHETVKRAINFDAFKKRSTKKTEPYWQKQESKIREILDIYPKLPSTRLYEILKDDDCANASLSSLRRFMRNLRPLIKEAFIKRAPLKGEEGQVDWAHFGHIQVGEAKRKLYLFVMTLSWSRYTFATFTFDMKTSTFLTCHIKAFQYFSGVPREVLYDNLKSAVIERMGKAIRFNDDMLDFAAHYHYEPKACSPYRGNEKGRVERKIRQIRSSFYPGRESDDIENLNKHMLDWLNKTANKRSWPDNKEKKIDEKFQEENSKLLALPSYHPVIEESKIVSAGKYPHITFDLNLYSIPPKYVGRQLLIRATSEKIKIYAKNDMISEHRRSWNKGQEIFDEKHMDTLRQQKYQGSTFYLNRREILREIPELDDVLLMLSDRGESIGRAVSKFIKLRQVYNLEDFKEALRIAIDRGTYSPDSVQFILTEKEKANNEAPKITPKLPKKKNVRELSITSHSLESYDNL